MTLRTAVQLCLSAIVSLFYYGRPDDKLQLQCECPKKKSQKERGHRCLFVLKYTSLLNVES